MINNKFFKIMIIILILVILPGTLGFVPEKGVEKNETVYVVLNYDGSIEDERVVNWVHGTSKEDYWTDYGDYLTISNMLSEEMPKIEGNKIIWPMSSLQKGDLYYQGTTDKELPVDISITYFLDGKEINGEEIAGKSGNLKIIFTVENKLLWDEPIKYIDYEDNPEEYYQEYYTPLLVQISLKADLNIFSDIVAEDGTKVVIGEEMNISFGSYPYPEDEFMLEMKGEKIELNPISVTIIPKEIPFPDLGDSEEGLIEMIDGLNEMENGVSEIVEGLDEMIREADSFESGSMDLVDAISEINHGANSLKNNSSEIDKGFSGLLSGIKELQKESVGLAGGLAEINQGLASILTNHTDLVAIAQGLVSSDPSNPTYQQLLAIAQGEQVALTSIGSGLNQLTEGISLLPDGINQLYDGQKKLSDGWDDYSNGLSELYDGTQQLYDETKNFPNDIDKLVEGVTEIKNGISELADDGIVEIKNGITESINDLRKAKALENKTNNLAESYSSFMNNELNKNSSVQFILQTHEIKIEEIEFENTEENIDSELSLWQEIISFFKR